SLLVKFLAQFKSFMIIVLLVAAVVSGIVGYLNGNGFTDAIIILVIVVANAIIGVFQEAKAEKSLDALEKLSSPHCEVVRDGQVKTIETRELVVGDVVLIETGDAVPADLRLVETVNIKVQEAALTGESVPEEKFTHPVEGEVSLGDRDNMVYTSSCVSYGRGKGIVVAVGMQSEMGKIASMIQSVGDIQTPLQHKLDKLGKILAIMSMAICAFIFIVGVLYGRDMLIMFMTAVSMAAAAIPEGLPAVSTIVLAVGVQRLAKKNAIVRKLPSVETLGSTQVICSDKTGTLTQNKMTVVALFANGKINNMGSTQVIPMDSKNEKTIIRIANLANDATLSEGDNAYTTTGDPTETALIDLGMKCNFNKNLLEEQFPRVDEIPFDSERKLMTTVHDEDEDHYAVYTKGGLEELLSCCTHIMEGEEVIPLTDQRRENIRNTNNQLAAKALRVLAMGYKKVTKSIPIIYEQLEDNLIFVGLVGMIDPPREEVKLAVAKCREAGIKPVMITGDHKITAIAIAEVLGIKQGRDRALTGIEIEQLSETELRKIVDEVSVYARVSPEHKVRIVKAFQKNGKIVAMTGDGVNDAPALKLADIGVAMGITGTDVSKEAADVVLTDDNFATIVSSVEEGRRIYDNILKAIQFMLSTNIGEILVLFIAVMANWISPLLPIHILWINLVTDSLPALALSVDPAEEGIMQRNPVDSRKGIMTKSFSLLVFLQGILIAALSLWAYHIGIQTNLVTGQTMTFVVLAMSQMTIIFSIRNGFRSAFKGMFSNKYLLGALAIVLALMLVVLTIPALYPIFHITKLSGLLWCYVVGLSIAPLLITEIVKFFFYWKKK
ncbi:MAG: cation-translocating P-type ATPase, partial [Bacteroidales bacterium]|nr:cation-translocating P-type ATPase [Bacteroidales bacterium]